jgi:hypothetical protein
MPFVQGCVPSWNKTNMRKLKALEHELTWCYYRMRRHNFHPERQYVGDPQLPPDSVVEKMRSGFANQFSFWRDLRPPFHVTKVRRDSGDKDGTAHANGELFHVTYQCGVDYVSERLWNEKGDAGTFDNMVHGTALMRIPEVWPRESGSTITMISWGKPSLNWAPEEKYDEDGRPIEGNAQFVDPDMWMPISQELGLRAMMPRFAACRQSTRKAHKEMRNKIEVANDQALLLGPHASLPRLAAAAGTHQATAAGSPGKVDTSAEGASPSPPSSKKKRQHRIFTSAAGFVRYAG